MRARLVVVVVTALVVVAAVLCAGSARAGAGAVSAPGADRSLTVAVRHACPATASEVTAAFGEKLVGPKPPINRYGICSFESAKKSLFDVVEISLFTPASLKVLHSTAKKYMTASRHLDAKPVAGIGLQAYIQDDNIFIRTSAGAVVDIGANFPASTSRLTRIARQVLPRI